MPRILMLHTDIDDVSDDAIAALDKQFEGHLTLANIDPHTPTELDDASRQDDVVAIYLQPDPLLSIVLKKGEVPLVLYMGGKLVRLKAMNPEFVNLDDSPLEPR